MEKRSNDLYAVAQECLLRNLVCLELEPFIDHCFSKPLIFFFHKLNQVGLL
jgi:hypothetical protein